VKNITNNGNKIKDFLILKKKQFSGQSGQVAVLVGILMVSLVGMAAFVVDTGSIYSTRRYLQTAADAAALAGAQELPDWDAAEQAANECGTANIVEAYDAVGVYAFLSVDPGDPTTTYGISVMAARPKLAMNFAQVLGRNTVNVSAYATAIIGSPSEIVPLSQMGYDEYANYIVPIGLTGHYSPGDNITLIDRYSIDNPLEINFYPLAINGGATVIYEGNIKNGVDTPLSIGVEVGTYNLDEVNVCGMVAPSIAYRVNQNLNYGWDDYGDITENGNELAITDSQFILCPRILPYWSGGPAKILDFLPFIITGVDDDLNEVHMTCLSKAIIINNSEVQPGVPLNGIIVIRLSDNLKSIFS
jgi:hypothetical protein